MATPSQEIMDSKIKIDAALEIIKNREQMYTDTIRYAKELIDRELSKMLDKQGDK